MSLFDHRMLLFTGKGGVGKSTVSAAVGLLARQRGKRVLLVEVNTESAMRKLFGVSYIGFEPLELIDGIWAINIDPFEALEEYILEQTKIKLVARMIANNSVLQYFFRTAPAVNEVATIHKIWKLERERDDIGNRRYDLLIVDLPATGHALAMLRIPAMIAGLTRIGPLYKLARRYQDLIVDPVRSCINLVTLPEEMPVNETIELGRKLAEEVGVKLGVVFANQIEPEVIGPHDLAALQALRDALPDDAPESLRDLLAAGENHAEKQRRTRGYLERLRTELTERIVELPRLLLAHLDRVQLGTLADHLDPQL